MNIKQLTEELEKILESENVNYVDSQGIKHYGYAINIKSFSYIEKKEKQAEQVNEPNPEEKTDFKNQDMQSGEIIKF